MQYQCVGFSLISDNMGGFLFNALICAMFVSCRTALTQRFEKQRKKPMLRKFALTSLVAASIAAAPVTAPAALARDKFDNFLIGLTAVGILGAIVHENNQNNSQVIVSPRPQYVPNHYSGHYQPVVQPHYVRPRECLRQKWTPRGWVQYYGQYCMNKQAGHTVYYRK
jgi:hypothetical protein